MSGGWVVRLPSWLGDTVMALPALRAVARSIDEPLALWGPAPYGELVVAAGVEADVIPFRRRRGLGGVSDAIHVIADLRHRAPSTALLLPNAFEGALLAGLAGIPRRIGYATDGRAPLLSEPIAPPRPGARLHEADRFAGLVASLGMGSIDTDDHLIAPTTALQARAAELLPGDRNYLGIAAGSANSPAKRWPAAAYAELVDAFDGAGARPVLLGSEADRPINTDIATRCRAAVVDLTGSSLTDLAATLLRCRLVVGNDSGTAHLSAALERPTVVIFGPTDAQRSCPRGPHVVAIAADCFCRPCESAECPFDHRCMTGLAPAAVREAAAPLWQADA